MNDNNNYNIIGNPTPVLTWNWLKVNDSMIFMPKQIVATGKVEVHETLNKEDQSVENQSVEDVSGEINTKISGLKLEPVMGADYDSWKKSQPIDVKNISLEESKTVKISLDLSNANEVVSDLNIYVSKNTNATVLIDLNSNTSISKDDSGFVLISINAFLDEGATLNLYQVQMLSKNFNFVSDINGELRSDSKLNIVRVGLGSNKTWNGMKFNLSGKNATLNSNLAYIISDNQTGDINDIAILKGEKTVADFYVDGVLMDKATKNYKGTIDFVNGCKGSIGDEKENVLMLSDDVINKSVPIILCGEEDVVGNHGTTIGKVDEKTMFYMQSRGISREEARVLIIKGKLNKILNLIPDNELINAAKYYVKESLKYEKELS